MIAVDGNFPVCHRTTGQKEHGRCRTAIICDSDGSLVANGWNNSPHSAPGCWTLVSSLLARETSAYQAYNDEAMLFQHPNEHGISVV
jgi:hypothetical protein